MTDDATSSAGPWIDRIEAIPLDWRHAWTGRKTNYQSTWITDGVLVVARSAVVDRALVTHLNRDIARGYEERLIPTKRVRERLAEYRLDRYPEIEAEWLGRFVGDDGYPYVSLGPPEIATFYSDRLRLLYELTKFRRATWVDKPQVPLRVYRYGEIVGYLMPVDIRQIGVPEEIHEAARKRWPER